MVYSHPDDLGFTHFVTKSNAVLIERDGKVVTTVRGSKANDFLVKMNASTIPQQQQLMARITGNYKRGNEKLSKNHPKNRD